MSDSVSAGLLAAPGLIDDQGNPTTSQADLSPEQTPGLSTDTGLAPSVLKALAKAQLAQGQSLLDPQNQGLPVTADTSAAPDAGSGIVGKIDEALPAPGSQDTPQGVSQGSVAAGQADRTSQAERLALAQKLQGSTEAPTQASTQAPAQAPAQASPQSAPVSQQAPASSAAAPADNPAITPDARRLALYSTIPPVPAQFQPFVDAALKKYSNVTPQQLQWVLGHETANYDVNAHNSVGLGHTGLGQFDPPTAKQYGVNPTDAASSIDGVAHYLSDLNTKYGSPEVAIGHYGTFSTGEGQAADSAAQQGYRVAMKNAGVNPGAPYTLGGGTAVASAAPSGPTVGQESAQSGEGSQSGGGQQQQFDPLAFMSDPRFQDLADRMRPSASQRLLAIASGLLGAPSAAIGLGRGLGAMNEMDMRGRQMEGELAKIGLSSSQMAAMMGYRNFMANNAAVRTGIAATNSGIQQEKVNNAVSGANAFGSKTGAAAAGDYKDLMEGAQTDALSRENITSAVDELRRNPGMYGPTLKSTVERYLTTLGLGNPGDLQAYQKATADQQAKYLENATGGHIASLRALGSIKMFAQAVAHADTDPSAAQYVFDSQLAMVNARDALRAKVNQDPSSWQNANFSTKEQQFYTDYFKQNPLPIYKPGYQSTLVGAQGGGSPAMQTANASAPPLSSFWK